MEYTEVPRDRIIGRSFLLDEEAADEGGKIKKASHLVELSAAEELVHSEQSLLSRSLSEQVQEGMRISKPSNREKTVTAWTSIIIGNADIKRREERLRMKYKIADDF